jgi:hypothetical protein
METIVQLHALAALSRKKSPKYPFDRGLGGPHIAFGLYELEKKISAAG